MPRAWLQRSEAASHAAPQDLTATRADWNAIRAVKAALRVPVLANGNIRHMGDVTACMAYTGADGVLSAEGLLWDPALFAPRRVPLAQADAEVRWGAAGRLGHEQRATG